jgi:hypothetical protein
MTDVASKPKRPFSVTLISVLAIYSGILAFYFVFSSGNQDPGLGNTTFDFLGGAVFLVCGVGFWLLKKWAVYTFAVFAAIDQVALLVMGRWNIFSLLLLAMIVYVGYIHLPRMS